MSKRKCHSCEEVEDRSRLRLVNRKVGGSYNRSHRWQKCLICYACLERLYPKAIEKRPGSSSVERWSKSGLQWAAVAAGITTKDQMVDDIRRGAY